MHVKRILVLGGGFAGLWAAAGAARKLGELGREADEVEVMLVNRDAFHAIRVRNYEADLSGVRVPLGDVLDPIGVGCVTGEVTDIDPSGKTVVVDTIGGPEVLSYDRLIFALGSRLFRPNLPGLAEYGFDVDTFAGAARLQRHLESLAKRREVPGTWTVVVVGAGLTGIEAAAEMPGKLRAAQARAGTVRPFRVILADHRPQVGSDMGDDARPVIEEALATLGIETWPGVRIAAIDPAGVTLDGGERVPAATVVWCAGMRANPLTLRFPVESDPLGRVPADEFLRVKGVADVYAAGDVAWTLLDGRHASVPSCQHSRPMGRFAGHNAVCDLFGLPQLPLHIAWYVTVLDLGPWGAVYTEGWDRRVVKKGAAAKTIKQEINCWRIYPPLTRSREEILAAAAPVVQKPPGEED